jgi:hypothetical protein
MIKRDRWSLWGVLPLIFCWLPFAMADARILATRPDAAAPAIWNVRDEQLSYDIAFLWFDRLAEARLSLSARETPGRFRVVLEARTLGLAAWLTGNRVQRYSSELSLHDDGYLRPLSYDADMYKTTRGQRTIRLKHWQFDFSRRQVVERVRRNGRARPETVYLMEDGPLPFDILGAFYNFRAGLLGPLQPGKNFRVATFARGRPSEIGIEILTGEQRPSGDDLAEGGSVVRVVLDPEVFDSGDGTLLIWFDDRWRPVKVVVKNVIGLGDVRATLRFSESKP